MRRPKHEHGFTLVELLVVIIIIGILAAVAVPAFMNQRQRATDAATISDVKNLALAVQETMIQCPNSDVFQLITTSATPGWTTVDYKKADGTQVGPFFSLHTLTYDYWKSNVTAIRSYVYYPSGQECISETSKMSKGTILQLIEIPGFSNSQYLIFGWNVNGKKYNGKKIDALSGETMIQTAWYSDVVVYDSRTGGIKQY